MDDQNDSGDSGDGYGYGTDSNSDPVNPNPYSTENPSGNSFFGGLLSTAKDLSNNANGIINAWKGTAKPAATTAAASTGASAFDLKKWMPLIIIAGIVALGLLIFARKR